jgi:hypothetical protein
MFNKKGNKMINVIRSLVSTREPCAHSFYQDLKEERNLNSTLNIVNNVGFNPSRFVVIKGTQQNLVLSSVAVTGITDEEYSILMKSSAFLKMLENGLYDIKDGIHSEVSGNKQKNSIEARESELLGGGESPTLAELTHDELNSDLSNHLGDGAGLGIDVVGTTPEDPIADGLNYDDSEKIKQFEERQNEAQQKKRGRPSNK